MVHAVAGFYFNLRYALVYFKNNAFKNEEEWRTQQGFGSNEFDEYKRLNFRVTSGNILPYLRIPLCDTSYKNSKIPIDRDSNKPSLFCL